MEQVLIKGDLAKLSEHERVNYYNAVCKSIGLNPLTRPFDYITLNGRLQLYAKRDACDQLRKIQNISLQVISAESVARTRTSARYHCLIRSRAKFAPISF
jgi:hypothetical protein